MDWSVTTAAGGLVLAVLSAWGGAAYAAGRAAGAADLRVSEAEVRIRGHVEARIDRALAERRDEFNKIWQRVEHLADMQASTNAHLAAIQATLKHIETALERLARNNDARQVQQPKDGGGD